MKIQSTLRAIVTLGFAASVLAAGTMFTTRSTTVQPATPEAYRASGRLSAHRASGRLTAHRASGRLTAHRASGRLIAHRASGRIAM
jgi:hypothetical protein